MAENFPFFFRNGDVSPEICEAIARAAHETEELVESSSFKITSSRPTPQRPFVIGFLDSRRWQYEALKRVA